ncbi:restriction endonuclease subunit S [Robertkochia solimangrovi]|uniref:restriction endonuclease subunit S n=1 Tax=Robertkochia solimangrovi TaxID=2213046 RepID=UPI00117C0536|nr:restriction endonuclease subunit S [Robertkochia solimangrovi]TRZ41670.1 hypothetical protein DMZ48_16820 [Robertkochia solimangrovi]
MNQQNANKSFSNTDHSESTWSRPRLNDITLKITDGAHSSPPSVVVSEGYPMYSVKNMTETGFEREQPRYIGKDDYNQLIQQGCKPKINDVLIAKDGSVLKYSFVIKNEFNGVLLSSIAIIRPDINTLHPEYLAQYFKKERVRKYIARALTTGSGVPRIVLKDFRSLRIPLPPLPEQKKIAEILSTWDEAIQKQEQIIAAKEKLKKGLMQQLLTGKKRFPGFEGDWKEVKLKEIFHIARGGSPRPIKSYITEDANGVNWIKIGDTKSTSKYIYSTQEKIKPSGVKKSLLVKPGDFILSNSMSFGRPYIMKTEGCIHDGWLLLRLKGELSTDFMYYLLGSDNMANKFKSKAAGSTVKNLNIKLVETVKVKVPSFEEQNRISNILSNLDQELEYMIKSRDKLIDQKKGLMQQLLTGKIRVNT